MQLSNEDLERLQRLSDALEKVQEMQGSPDIINSLQKAIKLIQQNNDL